MYDNAVPLHFRLIIVGAIKFPRKVWKPLSAVNTHLINLITAQYSVPAEGGGDIYFFAETYAVS